MNDTAALAAASTLACLFFAGLLWSLDNVGGALFVGSIGLFCFAGLVKTIGGGDDGAVATEQSADAEDRALAVLRERYARSELSDDEYRRRLETLLATETVSDAEQFVRGDDGGRTDAATDVVASAEHLESSD